MLSRRVLLDKASNYVVYYGANNTEALSKYDIAIVEPLAHTFEDIKKTKKNCTLVLAYISIVEIHPSNSVYKLLKEEDFLAVDNHIQKNKQFGTYIVDLRSKRWQSLLEHRTGHLLLESGYDGLFIDTASDIEYLDISPALRRELIFEFKGYLEKIKELFPDRVVVMNNGTEELIYHTKNLIDGICWENPHVIYKANEKWFEETAMRLSSICREENIKVLILTEGNHKHLKNRMGFIRGYLDDVSAIYYDAIKGYTNI